MSVFENMLRMGAAALKIYRTKLPDIRVVTSPKMELLHKKAEDFIAFNDDSRRRTR